MKIIVTLRNGTLIEWDLGLHKAIDQMVAAIKENCDWVAIVIHIGNRV